MKLDDQKLIKTTNGLNPDDQKMMKEKFISEYVRKKGWDKSNLSPDQMLEIVEQPGYKHPGMIYS